MNRNEYAKMHEAEGSMWWYRGLHANLMEALKRTDNALSGPLLDAGCGTGGFLARLRVASPETDCIGMDFQSVAASFAAEKSSAPICAGSINALPFADNSFGAIVSADVLCHRSVDQTSALASFRRCLRPAGVLILNLPAYSWMMSAHDRAVHTARRYSAAGLERILLDAGFAEVRIGYWNCLLFPLMALRRKLFATTSAESDVMLFSDPAETVFRLAMRAEGFVLKRGIRLPFGGSVLAVAVK
jgi:SAM-dependent methyltransferase